MSSMCSLLFGSDCGCNVTSSLKLLPCDSPVMTDLGLWLKQNFPPVSIFCQSILWQQPERKPRHYSTSNLFIVSQQALNSSFTHPQQQSSCALTHSLSTRLSLTVIYAHWLLSNAYQVNGKLFPKHIFCKIFNFPYFKKMLWCGGSSLQTKHSRGRGR